METKKGGRAALGGLLAIMTGVLTILSLPKDVSDIASEWANFRFYAPPEAVRLLLVAGIGVAAAWALAPGLAAGVGWLWRRWIERRERGAAALEQQLAAEREERERHAAVERQKRRVLDFVYAVYHHEEYRNALAALLVGPVELDAVMGKALSGVGIAERFSPPTRPGYNTYFAAYSLTDVARRVLEEALDILANPPSDES